MAAETQWTSTADHIPDQTLDASSVAGRQVHRLVDAEVAVRPGSHVLDDCWLDLVLGQIKGKDRFLSGCLGNCTGWNWRSARMIWCRFDIHSRFYCECPSSC